MKSKKRSKKITGWLTNKILEAIPFDDWVGADEIASTLGIRPQSVGIIIRHKLLIKHVERKEIGHNDKIFIYRRLPRINSPHH